MIARILPPEEWPRLTEAGADLPWQAFDPSKHAILVVEDDGAIKGCISLMWALHAECAWIAPESRKLGIVGRHLQQQLMEEADLMEAKSLWASAISDEMRDLLIQHCSATPIPGEHFIMPVQEGSCRHLSH